MKEEKEEKNIYVLFKNTVITADTVYYKKNKYIIPESALNTIDTDSYEVIEE
jgi:hypothetical protein